MRVDSAQEDVTLQAPIFMMVRSQMYLTFDLCTGMSLVPVKSHSNQSDVSRLMPSTAAVQKIEYVWTVPGKTSLLWSIDLLLSF